MNYKIVKMRDTIGDRILLMVVYITLSLLSIAILYPFIWVISASFSNPMLIRQGKLWFWPVGFHLIGYNLVFTDPNIMIGYRNSAFYMLVGTCINIFMTIIAAYPLSCKDFAGRKVLSLFFSFTMWFSGGIIPTFLLMKQLQLTNTIWAILLPSSISVWNLIIVRNYFQTSVPEEMREAAKIDGCSNIGYLFKIAIRLIGPIIAVMVVLYGVTRWNDYFQALIYLNDRRLMPLQLFLREILIMNQMASAQQHQVLDSTFTEMLLAAESVKYAAIITASLPVLLIYPLVQRHMLKGIMIGAIKG